MTLSLSKPEIFKLSLQWSRSTLRLKFRVPEKSITVKLFHQESYLK